MHDDEFPTIIGSGTDHHVSVSEHTGNAKTPQNNVSSHEAEIEARKHAFEAQALVALEEKKALAAAIAAHEAHAAPQETAADANIQKISADKNTNNRQTIANDGAAKPNVQTIGSELQQDNIQTLAGGNTAKNTQSIAADKAITNNRQSIDQPPQVKNVQTIPTEVTASNEQQISKAAVQNNQQTIEKSDPSLNRQSVDNGNIQSHFETLPSSNIALKKLDFPTSDNPPGNSSPAVKAVAADVSRKLIPKVAHATRAPMTAEELEDAKRQRDQLNNAFHGRLAGIKHTVEELNGRLTDFEEKVQKEDAKLFKGKPNDFKVDLG